MTTIAPFRPRILKALELVDAIESGDITTVEQAAGAGVAASLDTGVVGSNNALTWTSTVVGDPGNDVSIVLVNPGTASHALAVAVDGKKITATLATTAGAKQKETATAVGTITQTGKAVVTVTSALVTGSPLATEVDVAENDTADDWAAKVREALDDVAAITAHYTVGGQNASISLEAKVEAANDATLNIALADGDSAGITEDATSDNTTAGVAPVVATTAAQLKAAIANAPAAAALVTADDTGASTGAGAVTALAQTFLAGGEDGGMVTADEFNALVDMFNAVLTALS